MKYGSEVQSTEAHEEHRVITYILMQRIKGKTLKDLWSGINKTRKASIAKTLRTSFDQLRQLKHPGYFGNINGGRPPLDDVFEGTQGGLDNITSPFATEEDLINSVIRIYALETGDRTAHKVRYYHHVLPNVLCSNKAPVFTHNDLQRKNIIVQDDGTVVIIDWEY